jgi:hypothetical protein
VVARTDLPEVLTASKIAACQLEAAAEARGRVSILGDNGEARLATRLRNECDWRKVPRAQRRIEDSLKDLESATTRALKADEKRLNALARKTGVDR